MDKSSVSGNAATTSTARTRRHREKLRTDCVRLDITIGADVAAKLKAMTKRKGEPLWRVVEEAIEKFCD